LNSGLSTEVLLSEMLGKGRSHKVKSSIVLWAVAWAYGWMVCFKQYWWLENGHSWNVRQGTRKSWSESRAFLFLFLYLCLFGI